MPNRNAEPIVTPPRTLALAAPAGVVLAAAGLALIAGTSDRLSAQALVPAAVITFFASLLAPLVYTIMGPRPVSLFGAIAFAVSAARVLFSVAVAFALQKLLGLDKTQFWTCFLVLAATSLILEKLAAISAILPHFNSKPETDDQDINHAKRDLQEAHA